jgi:hypothetical protein
MTPIIVALIYVLGKVVDRVLAHRDTKAILRELRAIKSHLGIEVGEDGKVLVLRRSAAAAAEYQDELAKP